MNLLRPYTTSCFLEPFRLTMSRIASQAMILTSATTHTNELHGMTLGSVCSLSVVPKPLIQFNLHLPSYTSSELHNYNYLALHILSPTQTSVQLSRMFAKGIKSNNVKDGEIFHEKTRPFHNLQIDKDYLFYNIGDIKIPILKNVETTMICETRKNFPVDGHEIWVAEVIDILQNEQYQERSGGMLYFNRGFHKIGEPLFED